MLLLKAGFRIFFYFEFESRINKLVKLRSYYYFFSEKSFWTKMQSACFIKKVNLFSNRPSEKLLQRSGKTTVNVHSLRNLCKEIFKSCLNIWIARSIHPEVFLGKDVLKICSKFTGDLPCRSAISIKLLCDYM